MPHVLPSLQKTELSDKQGKLKSLPWEDTDNEAKPLAYWAEILGLTMFNFSLQITPRTTSAGDKKSYNRTNLSL